MVSCVSTRIDSLARAHPPFSDMATRHQSANDGRAVERTGRSCIESRGCTEPRNGELTVCRLWHLICVVDHGVRRLGWTAWPQKGAACRIDTSCGEWHGGPGLREHLQAPGLESTARHQQPRLDSEMLSLSNSHNLGNQSSGRDDDLIPASHPFARPLVTW
jgi:hypothetical protein